MHHSASGHAVPFDFGGPQSMLSRDQILGTFPLRNYKQAESPVAIYILELITQFSPVRECRPVAWDQLQK
jgi:hypothetical protein